MNERIRIECAVCVEMVEYAKGAGGCRSCMPLDIESTGHAGMTLTGFRSYIEGLMKRYQLWPEIVAGMNKYQIPDDAPEGTLMFL